VTVEFLNTFVIIYQVSVIERGAEDVCYRFHFYGFRLNGSQSQWPRVLRHEVFAPSNTGFVGLNPTRDMDVCVRLFSVYVVLCIGRGLATGSSPVQGVIPTLYRIKKLKSGQGLTKGYRPTER
jgi:hypothetical protein